MAEPAQDLVRVIRVRKGALKPSEFQLRPGEVGLSLFEYRDDPGPARLIQAVREAGKQGELVTALIPVRRMRELGLIVVPTPGGTPDAEVNALHREARVRWTARRSLWLRRRPLHEYFNERFAVPLCESARLEE